MNADNIVQFANIRAISGVTSCLPLLPLYTSSVAAVPVKHCSVLKKDTAAITNSHGGSKSIVVAFEKLFFT